MQFGLKTLLQSLIEEARHNDLTVESPPLKIEATLSPSLGYISLLFAVESNTAAIIVPVPIHTRGSSGMIKVAASRSDNETNREDECALQDGMSCHDSPHTPNRSEHSWDYFLV